MALTRLGRRLRGVSDIGTDSRSEGLYDSPDRSLVGRVV
jgi:hypothetical protein